LVAQLVEQRTENPRVGSSILSQATIFIEEKRIKRCAFCFWCVVGVSKGFIFQKKRQISLHSGNGSGFDENGLDAERYVNAYIRQKRDQAKEYEKQLHS
jgi:hypothetical protein